MKTYGQKICAFNHSIRKNTGRNKKFESIPLFVNVRKSHVVECALGTRFSTRGLGALLAPEGSVDIFEGTRLFFKFFIQVNM